MQLFYHCRLASGEHNNPGLRRDHRGSRSRGRSGSLLHRHQPPAEVSQSRSRSQSRHCNCCVDTTAAVPTTATTTASLGCSTTPPASWEISTCWALSPRGSRSTKSSTKRKNEFEENKIICPFLSDVKKKDKNCKIFSPIWSVIGAGGRRLVGKLHP